MLANFPRAYSHVALINCALNLARQTGPVEERAKWKRDCWSRPPQHPAQPGIETDRPTQTRSLIN